MTFTPLLVKVLVGNLSFSAMKDATFPKKTAKKDCFLQHVIPLLYYSGSFVNTLAILVHNYANYTKRSWPVDDAHNRRRCTE